jgi:hypothetical protein
MNTKQKFQAYKILDNHLESGVVRGLMQLLVGVEQKHSYSNLEMYAKNVRDLLKITDSTIITIEQKIDGTKSFKIN